MQAQVLDSMDLERERGITIKAQSVTLDLQGARRRALSAQLHRHAGSRGLLLRSLAIAGGLRGGAAGGRRLAGRGGAERRQLLHRDRAGPGGAAGHQQDRPAVRRSRKGDPRDRGDHRHRGRRRGAGQRQDRSWCRGTARAPDQAHSGAERRSGRAAAGADHRFLVRQLRRRGFAGARHERRAAVGRQDPRHVHRPQPQHRQAGPLHAEARDPGLAQYRARSASWSPASRRSTARRWATPSRSRPTPRASRCRLQADATAGVRRAVPGELRGLRAVPRRAGEAQAQRLGAALRARGLDRARLRLSLRLPRPAAHGHRAGAARARVRSGL